MGVSPLARKTPAADPGQQAANPATVAFRRPAPLRAATTVQSSERHFNLPVVLRLPDLSAAVAAPAGAAARASNPLVGKLMWVTTGVLALLAIWLVATAPEDSVAPTSTAPQWNAPDGAAGSALDGSLGPAAGSTHQPVPAWKTPRGGPSDLPAQRGPWRAEAQVVQPGAPEAEVGSELPAAARSASWPGDAWPGRVVDGEPAAGSEPEGARPPGAASAGRMSYRENAPPDQPPSAPPASPPAPGDPWAEEPRWTDDARGGAAADGAGLRTARRPTGPGNYVPSGSGNAGSGGQNNYAPPGQGAYAPAAADGYVPAAAGQPEYRPQGATLPMDAGS